MKFWKYLVLLATFAAKIPAASVSIGTVSGSPGQTVNLNVVLQTAGAELAAVQFDLSYDKSNLGITVAAGAASTTAQKQLSTNPQTNGVRVIIAGLNQTAIADGNIVGLTITIAANASGGTYPLALSAVAGSNSSGNLVSVDAISGSLVLPGGGNSPVLAVSKTHSGSFIQGQSGAAYSVTVSNHAGAGATSAAVTVTENLPTGLTLASMAGSGWSCSGSSCSRSDALNGGASYPVVAITVNVANNAPSTVTNQVSVTGGGSVSSFANDATTVTVSSGGQTITFLSPADISFGAAPFTLSATASSGLPVSFASSPQSVCTVSGSTLTVVSPGTCTVTASQAGNGSFAAATPVSRSFNIVKGGAPAVLQGGVVPVYSTSTTVQAGSWISIYGTNLSPSTLVWDGKFPIPQSLGGVSVTVNGKPGYLWFVSSGQINLQVPDDSTTGSVSVVVTTPAGVFTSTVTLGAASPSLSLLDAKHVAALTLNAGGGYDVVGTAGAFAFPTQPVAPGAPLILYGVGFGPTDPQLKAGEAVLAPAATVNPVTVTIGGVNAPVVYSGIVGVGLYQLNVTVPPGTPSGDQPIRASVSGLQTSAGNVVTIK